MDSSVEGEGESVLSETETPMEMYDNEREGDGPPHTPGMGSNSLPTEKESEEVDKPPYPKQEDPEHAPGNAEDGTPAKRTIQSQKTATPGRTAVLPGDLSGRPIQLKTSVFVK